MKTEYRQTIIEMVLQKFPAVWAIYLFGSFEGPYATPDSDIDVAVLSPKPLHNLQRWELAQAIATQLWHDVDLVDLRRASTVLRQQVCSQGRRIYCGNVFETELFETHVLSDYVRLNERRRGILEDIKMRGAVYAR